MTILSTEENAENSDSCVPSVDTVVQLLWKSLAVLYHGAQPSRT